MEWISQIEFWHWLILAVFLIAVEMLLLPAAYSLWMGIAAGVVGFLMILLPDLSFLLQILTFTVVAVSSLVLHKNYLKNNPPKTDEPTLNRRGEQYINRVFTLEEPIVNGVGKVKVDDTTWKIRGEDMDAGSNIKVSGVDGTTLLVEPE